MTQNKIKKSLSKIANTTIQCPYCKETLNVNYFEVERSLIQMLCSVCTLQYTVKLCFDD